MEMHSYAKTRTNKKWTIEHKRRLVDNRITLDVLFNKKTFNLDDSWIKLIKVSDMESFDLLFVRKQWTNILIKYKNLVQRHAINNYIDNETLDLLTAEWEFFDKIHRWIETKEKIQKDNYTKYYYNKRTKSIIIQEIENEALNQLSTCRENFSLIGSKHNNHQQLQPHYEKNSTEEEEPMVVLNTTLPVLSSSNTINEPIPIKRTVSSHLNDESFQKNSTIKVANDVQQQTAAIVTKLPILEPGPSSLSSIQLIKAKEKSQKRKALETSTSSKKYVLNKTKQKRRKLEKKLERLKRNCSSRFLRKRNSSTKRLCKKLNAFCEIFAKVIQEEYPNINVTSLIEDNIDDTTSYDSTDTN